MVKHLGELGVALKVDASNFSNNITGLNRQMRVVESTMKATVSSFGNVEGSSKKLGKEVEGLTTKYELQTKKVDIQKKKLEELRKAKGDDSVETQKASIELNKSIETLNKYGNELEDAKEELSSLGKESGKVRGENKLLQDSFKKVEESVNGISDGLIKTGGQLKDFGKGMSKRVSLPIVGAFAASTKAAIDWESAFAGVRKTVDGSETDYKELAKGIREMALELPQSATGLAEIAEMAGQLGIEKSSILDFTQTIADLGEATNMTTEQAATEMAKFANIMGMSQDEFNNLGSSLVELGNNFATTESDIMSMSMRLAGIGSLIGLTEADVLALSTVMSSLGIEAEAGGSAMTMVLKKMQNAVSEGGADLEAFALAAGTSAEEFTAAFKKDPMDALTGLVKGLEDTQAQGGNLNGVLESLGVTSIREADALLRLVGSSDLLTDAVEMSSQAWIDNTALSEEAKERYKTLASQIEILRNNIYELGMQIGDRLIPYVEKMIEVIRDAVNWFDSLDESTKDTVVSVGLIVAAIGPLLTAIGMFMGLAGLALKPIGALFGTLATLGIGGTLAAVGKAIVRFLGPVGLLVGGYLLIKDTLDGMGLTFGGLYEKTKGFLEGMYELFTGSTLTGEQILESVGFSEETIGKLVRFTEDLQINFEKLKIVLDSIKDLFTGEGDRNDDAVLSSIGLPPNMTEIFETFVKDLERFVTTVVNIVTGNMGDEEYYILRRLGLSEDLIYALNNIFETLRETLLAGIDLVVGVFTGDDEKVVDALGALGITPEMFGDVETLFGKLETFVRGVLGVIGSLVETVGVSALPLIEDIVVYASDLIDRFKIFWEENGEMIIETLQLVWEVAQPILGAILFLVEKTIPLVFLVIKMIFGDIKGFLDGIAGILGGTIELIGGIFTGNFSKMWEGVKSIFFGAIEAIWHGIQLLAVGKILKGIIGFGKGMIAFFKGFGKEGTGVFKGMGLAILEVFKKAWTWVKETVVKFKDDAVALFKKFREDGEGIFKSLVRTVKGSWTNLKESISNTVKSIYDNTIGRFTGMLKRIPELVKELKDKAGWLFVQFKLNAKATIKGLADDVVGMFKKLPKRIGDGISSMASGVWKGIKKFGNYLGKKLTSVINGVITGINFVTAAIGVETKIEKMEAPEFSTGTDGHKGGLMTVGDHGPGNSALGKTREIVEFPNGRAALFEEETTMNAPKGTKVYSNRQTEALLRSIPKFSTGTPGGGGGLFGKGADFLKSIGKGIKDAWEIIKNPTELIGKMTEGLMDNLNGVGKFGKDLSRGLFKTVKEGAVGFLTKQKESATPKVSGSSLFPGFGINYDFGKYPFAFNNGNHYGQDYSHVYDDVKTPLGGTVTRNFWDEGGGRSIEIQTGKIYQLFMHMNKSLVTAGQLVKAGQKIGVSGNTGNNSTGPHLHYQTHTNPSNFNAAAFHPNKLLKGGTFDYFTGGIINNEGFYRVGEKGSEAIIPLENKGVAAMMLGYLNELIGNDGKDNQRPNQIPKVKTGKTGGSDEGYTLMREQNEMLSKALGYMEQLLGKKDDEIEVLKAEREYILNVDGREVARAVEPHINKTRSIRESRDRRLT